MAVLGTLTLNEIVIYEVDADPSIGGLAAPSGSLAVMTDGSGIFHKGEGDEFDWVNHPRVIPEATKEPTGFVNRTDSVISFNESTREFSISPTVDSYDIYIQGKKLTISETLTLTISDTDQANFFYIDGTGQLGVLNAFNPSLFETSACVSYLLWDAEDNKAIVFAEERHGIVMDSATHSYLHTTRGSQLNSGGAISASLNGDGSLDSHAQIGLSNMVFSDEDIRININHSAAPSLPHQQILENPAELPIYYRSGASGLWKEVVPTAFPIKFGTTRAQYNEFTGTTWQLTDASADDKYLVSFVFATNNFIDPVIVILGQNQYDDLATAKAEGKWDSINFGTMPFQEFKLLYRLIYKTSSALTNTVKSTIVEATDLRFGADREISTVPVITDHGNLSGLSDDDHVQYHNNDRGDLRYYQKSEVDTLITQAEDRANHTGTQLASTISDFNEAAQDAVGNALLDSANINFTYPDVSNQITADLTDTGVVAGTYSLVTVDAKGRIIEGSNVGNATIYKYFNTATVSNTNATYTTVAGLTTQSLPVGLYKFSFVGRMQSAAAASGVGVRVSPVGATVTTCYGDWHLKQAANGVNAVFHYEQLATNTNVTSASVPALNTSFVVSGSGVFRVTVAGTVAIQIRGETNGTAATLQVDSSFIVEPA